MISKMSGIKDLQMYASKIEEKGTLAIFSSFRESRDFSIIQHSPTPFLTFNVPTEWVRLMRRYTHTHTCTHQEIRFVQSMSMAMCQQTDIC